MNTIKDNIFFITKKAHKNIIDESKNCPCEETGGVLIGLLDERVILEAGGPGPNANKGMSHFSPDVGHDQYLLDSAITKYGEHVTYLGYWHKHPNGYDRPSGGDLGQARQILQDFRNGGHHGGICTIITIARAGRNSSLLPWRSFWKF